MSNHLRWIVPLAIVIAVAIVFVLAPAVVTHAAGMNPN